MKKFTALTFLLLVFSGCSSPTSALLDSESAVKLRNMQSRRFDTTDQEKILRTAMATLQDLGFVIDKADMELGSVSATKLDGYTLRITVSVRTYGSSQSLVRANAQYNLSPVEDPEPYQKFYTAFEKALFLTAHNIN